MEKIKEKLMGLKVKPLGMVLSIFALILSVLVSVTEDIPLTLTLLGPCIYWLLVCVAIAWLLTYTFSGKNRNNYIYPLYLTIAIVFTCFIAVAGTFLNL